MLILLTTEIGDLLGQPQCAYIDLGFDDLVKDNLKSGVKIGGSNQS